MNYQATNHGTNSPTEARPAHPRFAELLACPACSGALEQTESGATCLACGCAYPSSGPSQRLDLRLRQPKRHEIAYEVGRAPQKDFSQLLTDLPPAPQPAIATWAKAPIDPGLAYGNGLSPELISYFPRAERPGQWMLDFGCGNRRYESLCRGLTDFNYIGVDFTGDEPDLLADAHALPFKDARFDIILSMAVLEHLEFPDVAMAEAFRVLKPGGTFIGSVAFLETFHMDSYFHMTHLGTLRVLRDAGFEVVALAPNRQWSGLRAQASMSLFPLLRRRVREALVKPLEELSKLLWAMKRARSGGDETSDLQHLLETTAGFRFIARRPA
jgi:SAM-dependent methyltransferase